jgi:hypothetical protein
MADANLVFGGREIKSSGRFPGIAEEVMLSLAAGNPVYVCGGFRGAAQAVGMVLGLGERWAMIPDCFYVNKQGKGAVELEIAVKSCGGHFQLPPHDLPVSYEDLVNFLCKHALDSPGWVYNGLTAEENRRLFRSQEADEIVELVNERSTTAA